MPVTVACVCVPGGIYGVCHVERLCGMLMEHMTEPFEFACIVASDRPGWWAKIDLFKPGMFAGRVLYLDLDVTIVGDLAPLIEHPAPFVIARNWERRGPFNSSVMAWDAGAADHIHERWTPDVMQRLHGDQDWIAEQMPDAATFPKPLVVSYKADVLRWNVLPADARVVAYHGQPKPWDLPADHLETCRMVA